MAACKRQKYCYIPFHLILSHFIPYQRKVICNFRALAIFSLAQQQILLRVTILFFYYLIYYLIPLSCILSDWWLFLGRIPSYDLGDFDGVMDSSNIGYEVDTL